MPQFPIVVPVIVLGIAVGSLLRSNSSRISKKLFAYAALAAGLLNVAYGYAFLLLFPSSPPTFATTATTRTNFAAFTQISEPVFLSASFLVAVLMVVAVLGVAQIYIRLRKGGESEEAPEVSSDDSKLAG